MKKIYIKLAMLFIAGYITAQPSISLQSFGPSFNDPVDIQNVGDTRLFIVEKRGRIQILNDDGSVNATPFLDIDDRVINTGSERGLLGLAFHPDYVNNGYFYVNYINNSGNTVVSRFSRNSTNDDLADSTSESIMMTVTQPYSNHNGGDLAFGSDGYLYISLGDGGSGGDPGDRSQSLDTLLGKLLRIDVDNGLPYTIPADNPYLNDGDANTLPEIWAYGLRNAWRFSIDSATDDLWIADVGQNEYEEINRVPASVGGVNYGWRCYEGNHAYNTSGCAPMNTMIFPVAEYAHSTAGEFFKCSITGGYMYSGSMYPNFNGLYFFADYCSDEIGYLEDVSGTWEMTLTDPFTTNGWSTFGEDMNGELYIAGTASGQVYKIQDDNLSTEEFINKSILLYPNPANSTVTIVTNSNFEKAYELYDITGNRVLSFKTQEMTKNLDVSNLNSGLYLLKCTFENKVLFKKLIVN